MSTALLVHFDKHYELLLAADASPYGVGTVLSHQKPDGTEQPIAYSSRSLAAAEPWYSQLHKEGLAIIFCRHQILSISYRTPLCYSTCIWPQALELPLRIRQANSVYGFSPHLALVTATECLQLQHLSPTWQGSRQYRHLQSIAASDAARRTAWHWRHCSVFQMFTSFPA